MDKLIIEGPARLQGNVKISSSKNASLPILAGVLLSSHQVKLKNLPKLADVTTMLKLIESLGVTVSSNVTEGDGRDVILNGSGLKSFEATYDWVKTMRASIVILGPLLTRYGRAKVSLPGGCAIGARPIDMHLKGLEKMGAQIELRAGYVEARTSGLHGASILLPFPSVGATENLMMAAVLAKGTTCIQNAAQEPEIEDLGNFLNSMGAKVEGAGTAEILIEGVTDLRPTEYSIIGDRIEAATYLIAAIMTNSSITIENIHMPHIQAILDVLAKMGAKFNLHENSIEVLHRGDLQGVQVDTAPYPGFPTDVQAQLLVLSTLAKTPSVITEHIFENRFMHVPELNRMGADIVLRGNSAFVPGNSTLTSAPVMCTDLRASAALVLAALMAEGETEIRRIYHLDRGYEKLDKKLQDLGVKILRTPDKDSRKS